MSARRSSRAKAPVKYTSDSEASDVDNKKPPKTRAPAKKRVKAEEQEDEHSAVAPSPTKRAKKDASASASASASAASPHDKASKTQHKAAWASYLQAHDTHGALLSDEPARSKSITQTASMKKYALQKKDLAALQHFAKKNPNPVFKNTLKLFVEEQVRTLGFRKLGVLDGAEDIEEAVARGEKIWRVECNDDDDDDDDDDDEASEDKKEDEGKDTASKPRTHKQIWTAYVEKHTAASQDSLDVEPEEPINQSDCKAKYSLLPGDLAVLSYFPKPNQKYGKTTKLFSMSEVQALTYRKAAVLGGVEDGDEVGLLKKGKELFEEKK